MTVRIENGQPVEDGFTFARCAVKGSAAWGNRTISLPDDETATDNSDATYLVTGAAANRRRFCWIRVGTSRNSAAVVLADLTLGRIERQGYRISPDA